MAACAWRTRASSARCCLEQPPEAIDKGIAPGHTNRRALPAPIPIFIVYQTAFVESDGSIQFRPDLYERDDEIWHHLRARNSSPSLRSRHGQRKG